MKIGIRALVLFVLFSYGLGVSGANVVIAEPDYAKWGRIAMQETAKRYRADIVDYKHLGRKTDRPGIVSESFKLILNSGTRQFGIKVQIWFEQESERITQIQFTEEGKPSGSAGSRYRII
ncbi:YqzG/YhdC family protein [Paenibacillus spongiae]|uniref:YqzG/YhdC family protein n=1 Tax=Paenibacillus spongiae TaxID=2909671 RepID=A0ABY5SF44_9BACL|nr:YqzG/YhdC family protein [Paenibacillus spongiae]UVI32582.1 YqzG/YhdC family protein [Paenibacillus spongiae]